MATIRTDLVGTAMVRNAIGEYFPLPAGAEIPAGFWAGGHLVQGGDPNDQTPPWRASAGGTVAWADVTGKPETFAPAGHTHEQADVDDLDTALAGKAEAEHTHEIADVDGLQSALDGKADA